MWKCVFTFLYSALCPEKLTFIGSINQASLSSGFWLGLANLRHWQEIRGWAGRGRAGCLLSCLPPCRATEDYVCRSHCFRNVARDPSPCWAAVVHSLLLFLGVPGGPSPNPFWVFFNLAFTGWKVVPLLIPSNIPFFLLEPTLIPSSSEQLTFIKHLFCSRHCAQTSHTNQLILSLPQLYGMNDYCYPILEMRKLAFRNWYTAFPNLPS